MGFSFKGLGLLSLFTLISIGGLVWWHVNLPMGGGGGIYAKSDIEGGQRDSRAVSKLLNLIHAQNNTIVMMGALLEDSHKHIETAHTHASKANSALRDREKEKENRDVPDQNQNQDNQALLASQAQLLDKKNSLILRLNEQLSEARKSATDGEDEGDKNKKTQNYKDLEELAQRLTKENNALKLQSASLSGKKEKEIASQTGGSENLVSPLLHTKLEAACEKRFGLSLIDDWRRHAETWCDGGDSKLVCYPYEQAHKMGRKDMFCVATNFIVDFSKISGEPVANSGGPGKRGNYLSFSSGALSASCKKTSKYNQHQFMPHHSSLMGTFQDGAASDSTGSTSTESTPTYLLARDEDCDNSFHSTADFMNMFLVGNVVGIPPEKQQVILWDKHPNGPYLELIEKAFAGGKNALRHSHYKKGSVKFEQLVFHLESPAGLIFPKVSNTVEMGGQLRCKRTGMFTGYAAHILESFGLNANEPGKGLPPAVPHATLITRHRTSQKNVGRILANEDEVVGLLKRGNMMTHSVVDMAKMPYQEQLALARRSNIIIGVHGAGLMLILFAAAEAALLEIHPSYRQDRHFRHAARMAGKDYLPVRSLKKETCVGSSDNVFAPMEELEKALDGAVRLARNYDDGISECGLKCHGGILALDKKLAQSYGAAVNEAQKSAPVNTRFPC